MSVQPRVVVVSRPTEMDELLNRHGTRGQIEFFLDQRDQSLDLVERRHALQTEALATVDRQIPEAYRRSKILREDLDRWLFEPDDIVVVVGQDGLVANVAKYLDGQPVIGINSNPAEIAGVLVRHGAKDLGAVLQKLGSCTAEIEHRSMVAATLDDGHTITALNELFVGVASHQSARYRIDVGAAGESQSSSGLVVGSGTGATGWCASLWQDRAPQWQLPAPASEQLVWFVREAWPSPFTGCDLTDGLLESGERLSITSKSDALVVFGDGIESDRLELTWGQTLVITRAAKTLALC